MVSLLCFALTLGGICHGVQGKAAPKFEIKDGDRVVMVGSALIERDQHCGCLESGLHLMFPLSRFTVRNLGWSGDTVWGEARAGFGNQQDGFKKLVEQVKAERPTVLILGYGTNESFGGPAGLQRFTEGYETLLRAIGADQMRLLFIAPPFFSHRPPHLDLLKYEKHLSAYWKAISTLAEHHNATVFQPSLRILHSRGRKDDYLTDDGIIPNVEGYGLLVTELAIELKLDREFRANRVRDYNPLGPLIIKKNELYFHRYRPQNDTYLHGFRKHEQGQNAREVPQFDQMVEELDRKIIETKLKIVSEKK
jgi:lysophospholipase L1-like esterase